jgi:hypothetical protein
MMLAATELPDDVETLKAFVLAAQAERRRCRRRRSACGPRRQRPTPASSASTPS